MRKLYRIALVLLLTLSVSTVSCSTDNPITDIERPLVPNHPDSGNGGNNNDGNNNEGGENGDNNDNNDDDGDGDNELMSNNLRIIIGSTTFEATLEENAATVAFKALLPMTVDMSELNGNEKYYYLSQGLPTSSSAPGTIHTGDLMLYGTNCIVLFYETFSTSYSYIRLGRVDDPSGLTAALGSGKVKITFELQ